jgi:hypothetical protein
LIVDPEFELALMTRCVNPLLESPGFPDRSGGTSQLAPDLLAHTVESNEKLGAEERQFTSEVPPLRSGNLVSPTSALVGSVHYLAAVALDCLAGDVSGLF